MTNVDLDPEPSSIAPMALDTNQWKIDLNNLHSGERFDFSIPPRLDDDEEVVLTTGKPRGAGRRVIGVMTAVVLVAGLGFAAFRARPLLARVTASAPSRVAQTTMTPAPVTPPPVTPPAVVAPPPPVAPVAVAAPAPPPPEAAKATKGTKTIPTFSANALPNAPKAKRGKRAK